ncbi:cytoplasmic dynein 2 intermediate chain 1 isoform X2 [Pseudophryne corroboree]|uniref:cytoplasmic dynein 2 intermediate chain 1 isoform X2 n=1 Tax=Pseudophryne corroboree TaxID=495146 RepID=UPI00308198D8
MKTKEDTWKAEELKKHLKTMQSEDPNNKRPKERRHHREEYRDERAKHRTYESSDKTDEKERHKYHERERPADRERDKVREHRREKEKVSETDRDKHKISERHKIREREQIRERKNSGENPAKEYGMAELSRDDRKMRDSLDKNKHRSDDRERRHQERRAKEGTKRENEDHKDQDQRHRKHREDLNSQDIQQERRRSDWNHSENSEREKRHHRRREKGTHGDMELRSTGDSVEYRDRVKETSSKERSSQNEEQQHREKRENRAQANERKKNASQENSASQSRSKKPLTKQESDEQEIEETIYNTDAAYEQSTNYEEDFEDYDDDFEEESEEDRSVKTQEPKAIPVNAEIQEIQKAMLLENENIASASTVHRSKPHDNHGPKRTEQNDTPRKGTHRGVLIDFGSAKQRQVNSQVTSKQKKRSLEILRLIDLDFSSTFSLLDLAPVKEYEMYIRNFGKTNTKQAYIQCNDDAADREIQTEEIDIEEKWTQHPGEGAAVCGGHKNNAAEDMGLIAKVDSQRLTTFLHSASQVITVLLEENRAETQFNRKVQPKEPCMSISDGCFSLNTNLPFIQGRTVYHLHFSDAQRHQLLTVHGQCKDSDTAILREKVIICVWNIWQPSTPQKILICESEVKCCCFSPSKASLVFAGTADGSVVVWDLREDFSMHQTMRIEDTNWTFRSATFSTDGVFTQVGHSLPVKAIEPVPSTEAKDHEMSSLSSREEMSGLSFQVASLDESGHLIFWVVVELRKADLAGSQSDLGLIPGGKVKLVHSSSIHLSDRFFHKDVLSLGIPQTFNIKFLPQDLNHFVIGTDIGIVTHGTRYGLIEPPMQYTSMHSKLRPSQVTAIDFSPFGEPAFLAGCSDGCLRLHIISAEYPAMQWNDSTNGQSITALQWSLTRPTVFFVLDSASSIYIWDLLQNDLKPVAIESIIPDQVLSMSVFGEPEKNNNLLGLALAKSSGKVEIQYIKKQLAKIQPKELEKLHLLLHEIL